MAAASSLSSRLEFDGDTERSELFGEERLSVSLACLVRFGVESSTFVGATILNETERRPFSKSRKSLFQSAIS